MELRKAEAEVGELRLEYENLRLATVTDADLCLSSVLPPLIELLAQIQTQQDRSAPSAPEGTAEPAPSASDGSSGGDAADDLLSSSVHVVSRAVTAKEALESLEEAKSRLGLLEKKM